MDLQVKRWIRYSLSPDSSSEDEQEAFERKMQEKRFWDQVKTTEEELCPKATGHEARLEKKALARERKRQRDTSPGLSDKVLLGDSSRKLDTSNDICHLRWQKTLVKERNRFYADPLWEMLAMKSNAMD